MRKIIPSLSCLIFFYPYDEIREVYYIFAYFKVVVLEFWVCERLTLVIAEKSLKLWHIGSLLRVLSESNTEYQ